MPQGCGMGPSGWAVISTGNLDSLQSEGFGTLFETPISHSILEFVSYAHVEDTDQVETIKNFQENSLQMLLLGCRRQLTCGKRALRPQKEPCGLKMSLVCCEFCLERLGLELCHG
mmetsp:Transcript_29796/g.45172  ORF Transcript_29796/g.45172 Transcript_29796/m.45172 type:complete len:115 (-) Transcript_29796:377-721(-)